MKPHTEFIAEVAEVSRPLVVPERTREVMHKDYTPDLKNEPMKNRADFNKKTGKLNKEEWNDNSFGEPELEANDAKVSEKSVKRTKEGDAPLGVSAQ